MSDNSIVKNMIDFVENNEKALQAEHPGEQSKVDIVKMILDKLEKEIANEDKQN